MKVELPRAAGKLWLRMMMSVCVADSFRCGEDERSTYYEKRRVLLDELHPLTTLRIVGELSLFHCSDANLAKSSRILWRNLAKSSRILWRNESRLN